MRIATYNVENLFQRAKALDLESWAAGAPILDDYVRLNDLIKNVAYTPKIKQEILSIMKRHRGLLGISQESEYIILRQIRSGFLSRPKGGPVGIKANGKDDWLGWFELKKGKVTAEATNNTARIIGMLEADVLCVVEAEDRIGLKLFNDEVIRKQTGNPFDHVMLIDGNDGRGIDVGIMTSKGYEILGMRSHVDDTDDIGEIFSRDCAEYEIVTPLGNKLVVLLNHFKSKMGDPKQGDAKRLRQATRVYEIYQEILKRGDKYVAILGDLNDPPANAPLQPLTGSNSGLTDIMAHSRFTRDSFEGTWGNANASQKFDYILMSPVLSAKVTSGGVVRNGVWAGANGHRFSPLPTVKSARDAASDHAALWAEFDL